MSADDAGRRLRVDENDDPRAALGERAREIAAARRLAPRVCRAARRRARARRELLPARAELAVRDDERRARPGESRFTNADSNAPVPEAVKTSTSFVVRNTSLQALRASRNTATKSGERWWITGSASAAAPRAAPVSGPGVRRRVAFCRICWGADAVTPYARNHRPAGTHRCMRAREPTLRSAAMEAPARLRRRARLAAAHRRARAPATAGRPRPARSPGPASLAAFAVASAALAWGAAAGWSDARVPPLLPLRRAAHRRAARRRLAAARSVSAGSGRWRSSTSGSRSGSRSPCR